MGFCIETGIRHGWPAALTAAGQEGYSKNENATQVAGEVIPPVVSPVCKEKESHRAVETHKNVSHVGVIIGTDGPLDLIAASEQRRTRYQDQRQGDPQDADGPSHGIIRYDLGRFIHH